jgi:WD40 repeat protein
MVNAWCKTWGSKNFINISGKDMTLQNDPGFKEGKKEASRDYVWVFAAIFVCFILCLAIVFCGLGAWAIKDRLADAEETPASEPVVMDILAEVKADPAWQLLVDEEFNDNKNEWYLEPYNDDYIALNRSIENGVYIWDYQATGGSSFWDFPSSMTLLKDFVATVEIKHTAGNLDERFGFILRASLDRKYYLLQISESGTVLFQSEVLGSNEHSQTLFEGTSSAIKTGEPNIITVRASGGHFIFYVNNVWAGEVRDDQIKEGYVGVLTSTSGGLDSFFQPISLTDSKLAQQTSTSRYEVDNFEVWVPKPAVPTPSPVPDELDVLTLQAGRIVYVSDVNGNSEIYTVNSDGTDIHKLTSGKADDFSPKWSFDGEKIVFVSTRDGNAEIYTMRSDGTEITRISHDPADDLDPAFSPDGKSIIFSSNRDGNYEIYVQSLENDEIKRMTENNSEERYPDWSAKDDLILYQSIEYGSAAIYTMEISSGESTKISPRILPFEDSRPRFSRDGSRIVYTAGNNINQTGIMIYELATALSIDVVIKPFYASNENGINLFPTFSNDGRQIAFSSHRDGQTDIYIISSDGKSIFRVTETDAVESELDWTDIP